MDARSLRGSRRLLGLLVVSFVLAALTGAVVLRAAPGDTMSINDDSSYTTTDTVTINSTVAGAAMMSFSNDNANWSDPEPYASMTATWTLSPGDGEKTVYGRYWDSVETTLAELSDTITLDTAAPTATISINDGAPYTTSRSVTVTAVVSVDAAEMRFSEDGSTWSAWEPYSSSKSLVLTDPGDGLKTVYAEFNDAAGNASVGPISDTITLDTAAPTGSMSIDAGAAYTGTVSVTLGSAVTGADFMSFSNDGVTWSTPETYSVTKTWTLSVGDGLKTVYALYRDAAGNTLATSDTISLDTAAPSGTMSINAGAAHTATVSVTLGSAVTGAAEMRFMNAGGTWSTWEPYATTRAWTLSAGDGLKTVNAEYRDAAGNPLSLYDTITLDTTAPGPPTFTAAPDVDLLNGYRSAPVAVTLSGGSDAGSGLAALYYQIGAGTPQAYVTPFVLPVGTVQVTYWSVDNLGLESSHLVQTVKSDAAPVTTHVLESDETSVTSSGELRSAPVTVTLSAVDTDEQGVTTTYYSINGDPTAQTYAEAFQVTAAGDYTIQYRSVDAVGKYEATKTVSFTIDATAPNAPPNLRWTNVTNTTVTLVWDAATDAAGIDQYEILQPARPGVDPHLRFVSGTTLSYTFTGLTPGARYGFYVKAIDGVGNYSALSNYLEVRIPPTSATSTLPVYRFYNAKQGVHFYTASEAEKNSVISKLGKTYKYEGVSYVLNLLNGDNSVPLYRFYNFKKGVHFYTASEVERATIISKLSSTYAYEGIAYFVSRTPTNGTPVYRFFNVKQGVHFYTASEAEKNSVIANLSSVYRYEGIAYYIGN